MPLGLKNPLLVHKPLGKTLKEFQFLYPIKIADRSLIQSQTEMLLSPYGKTELAKIYQTPGSGELGIEYHYDYNIDLKRITLNEERLSKANLPPESLIEPNQTHNSEPIQPEIKVTKLLSKRTEDFSLPAVVKSLIHIQPLTHISFLGKRSLNSLQVLNLTPEPDLLNDENRQFSTNQPSPIHPITLPQFNSSGAQQNSQQPSQLSDETIPNSWSSIAELIGETSSIDNLSNPFPVINQPGEDEFGEFVFTPEGIRKLQSPQVPSSGYVNPLFPYQQNRTTPQNSASPDKPERESSSQADEAKVEIVSPYAQVEDIVTEANLENLAQEVYKFVRQRLEIERERYGRR